MKRYLLSNERGFTLLEVLIALTVFSVGLLAIGEMTMHVIRNSALGDKMTDARIIAEDKLEELRVLPFTDPSWGNGYDNNDISTDVHSNTSLFTNPDHTQTCNASSTVTCSVTIDEVPQVVWNVADNTPATGMKTVTVIVGWEDTIEHYVALSSELN
ncbi:MAG: prepilin-type N-terminal cleavage/methylation domain-containing protein [Thermodesulfobacteriota bacterium]|nr:prepilin-type N-terminal cleavage/methylation domain-containing protein [Thermodesulfobacteriota bacterium]